MSGFRCDSHIFRGNACKRIAITFNKMAKLEGVTKLKLGPS